MEGLYWIFVILLVNSVAAENQQQRFKRQLGMTGGDACLQIYSVPRETVKCQPTDDVVEEFQNIHSLLDESSASMEALSTRVDGLDPDRPKEFPEELKEKLRLLEDLQLALNGSIHTVKILETRVSHLGEKVDELEADERREVAELVALQTDLIGAVLERANLSIHDAYIDRLNTNARDLVEKLNRLEINLQERILDAQKKFDNDVKQATESARLIVENLQYNMNNTIIELRKSVEINKQQTDKNLNATINNSEEVEGLKTTLTFVQEQLQRYDSMEVASKAELTSCNDEIDKLKSEVASIKETMKRTKHIVPKLLK
ncbi:hypothetical protein CAPTEDRAFT_205657, partial [Capitella teleta]